MLFTGTGNANKISGIPVQAGTPANGNTLQYDAATSSWIFAAGGGVGGGANLTTVGSVPFVTSSGVLGQNTNFRFFNGTGNLVIGTTTDGNFKLDVANSGSSGGFRVWDQRATIGSTSLVVRAGGGQSGNLTEWQASNGTTVSGISTSGLSLGTTTFPALLVIASSSGQMLYVDNNSVSLNSPGNLGWTASVNATSAKDLSLSRASAGVLQVGDGGSNSNGIILSRRVQSAGETVASLPAAAAGNAGTISYVTDSNSTTIGATVAGGGANKVLVWSNGTAWRIFAN